jgi:DNA-directed RNA polymerase subunit M
MCIQLSIMFLVMKLEKNDETFHVIEMDFCPKCGTRLIYTSNRERSLFCPQCHYKTRVLPGHLQTKALVSKSSSITIVDEALGNMMILPTARVFCERCGGNKAETWDIQTGSERISDVTFYRCISCRHTWRENG